MTPRKKPDSPHRLATRAFGIFFLLAFISYGAGSTMVADIAESADGLAGVFANKTTLTLGFILMAVIHSFFTIGLAVIMLPILKPHNKTMAYGYFSAAITATVVTVIGAMSLLLLVPLSEAYVLAETDAAYFGTLSALLKQGGFYGYQLGMTLWGLGGLMFCHLLFISKLVPRVFPIWGFAGYVIFITGTIGEIFGYPIGLLLSAPGGLFEIALSLWLIVKGPKT
ncbi:MAG: DUF4386 domain-containing protein [Rhodobacteraceae bacterium]|nr:DUF4386 domain-containing protein [Paracoccaceae bacterium]